VYGAYTVLSEYWPSGNLTYTISVHAGVEDQLYINVHLDSLVIPEYNCSYTSIYISLLLVSGIISSYLSGVGKKVLHCARKENIGSSKQKKEKENIKKEDKEKEDKRKAQRKKERKKERFCIVLAKKI
jgi:hypothetical protein